MSSVIFVSAVPSADGSFAQCSYFSDKKGNDPLPGPSFSIPKDSGSVSFVQTDESQLVLIGATFSTLGSAPQMNPSNFSAANGERIVNITMPTSYISTKGIVLLFSNPDVVDNIYPSSDPQVTNDGGVGC